MQQGGLQKEIASSDVNIVPLVENEFTHCKSELKFFEAAIVDTVSCTTPTYMFRKNITQGESGFLCKQGEWFDVINKIYKKDFNRDKIITTAHNYCISKYSPQSQTENIENILNEILNN